VQGALSLGEPRILAPEPPGSDERPRWIVLTICDALRGDILDQEGADRLAPALAGLSRRGQRYDQAFSPGAHTQAAFWPLVTGRVLARVDPVRARRFKQMGSPLELVYSRGNIPVSHLAQAAGYHPVFLGNNSFLLSSPLFARYSNRGKPDTGTVDTIAALPAVLSRYSDERVFLLFYVSTPHNFSFTPRRLFERLGCGSLNGVAEERCAYDARVAHADEAIEALQQGLADVGLERSTLQVLTADHGEVFGDGRSVETELYSRWYDLGAGHGGATHTNELRVPLIVTGPGLQPAAWAGRVSTLDVVPTLASIFGFPTPQKLDGRVLPLSNGPRTAPPPLVSQGFCTHSVLSGSRQLVWWEAECARRREVGSGRPQTPRAELWRDGVLEATDESDPDRLAPLLLRHFEWLAERLPGDAWLLDASRLGLARVSVTATEGVVADWGPAGGPGSLGAVGAVPDEDGRQLRIDFRGDAGLFFVSTWPKAAPVRFDVDSGGHSLPVAFVGPLQLPLALLGRVVDPRERPELWLATTEPARPVASGPHLRVWRQPYHRSSPASGQRALTELDRVLREWGYIR
jgi:arylsulfatase A-like enzyme